MPATHKPLIDVRPDLWDIVRDILQKHVPQYEVWAFGSRAKWSAKEYSDLDLCVITDKPLSLSVSAALADDFSESDLPWKVDVVDWASTAESFRKIIEREKVVVQRAGMSEWRTYPLSSLLAEGRGISYGIVQPGIHQEDGIPIVRVADIRGGQIAVEQPLRVSPDIEAAYARTRLCGGELLLTLVGTVGEAAVVPPEMKGWNVARAVAVIPIRKDVGAYWVKLALEAPEVREMIHGRLNTTVQATLNLKDVAQLPILLPKADERERIAHILGTLDDKIELNRRMNETLEAIARAMFKSWFVDFDPVRAKMNGEPPESICQRLGLTPDLLALFPDRLVDSELGEIPEGWEVRTLGFLASVKGGKQLDKEEFSATGKNPVFGGAGIMGRTDASNADGAVITVGRVGAYCGQFFWYEGAAWVNNNSSRIQANDQRDSLWIYLGLKNVDMGPIKRGAAQPFVSNGDIAELPIIVPSVEVRKRFSAFANPIYSELANHSSESELLAQTRDTLLPKLLSGELRVPDAVNMIEESAA